MKIITKCIIVLPIFVAGIPAFASPGADAPVTKAYVSCLATQAPRGSYTSTDGGKSAIYLMGDCRSQWEAWQDACEAGGESDGDCTTKAAMLAQAALKGAGK